MHTSCDPLRARTTGAQSLISKITAALAGPLLVAGFYVLIPGSSAVAATAVPPEVPGANWLSGHGVNVCYPIGTPCTGTTVFPAENPRGTTPYNWQCEELTARLWSTLNWYSGNWTQNAYELYGGLASSQVTNHPNDGSYVPVPGDLIVHAANDGFAEGAGHVAVVDSVDPGTLTIHAVEENVNPAYETSAGRATYTKSGGHWTRQGTSARPIGFVHANADSYTDSLAAAPQAARAGSFEGDGKADLIAVDDSGTFVMTSNGTGFSAPVAWSSIPFYGTKATLVGDVNGDGKADLIAVDDSGTFVMTSNGTGFSAPVAWSSIPFYGTR